MKKKWMMAISEEVLNSSVPCSTLCAFCVCCLHIPRARKKRKCLKLCMHARQCECVHILARACNNDYRFPYLWPSPPSRLPICWRSRGSGGRRGKKGGGGKKAIGRFWGERCSGPVSFYGPLKKKKRENEHPSCLDWLLLLHFPSSATSSFLHFLK